MTPKKLGRYEVLRVIGKGAMGVVYEGRDPNLDRRVAIKTVKVENLSEEAAAEYEHRFRTEARSAARLQHPNIVSVYDSDRDADVAFLVMEFIQGEDLKHHLDRGVRYSLEQSLKIVRDLLSALDYAHKQGIVHRDIKPANLLIEPAGRVKLTDFGVARIQDSGEATRTQGSMVGTLKYMAPEQVQGQKIDSRADLFSAGVVLYQLITDKRPFDGDNDFSIIHQIIGHTPAAPSEINPRLPSALDAVVARALAKQREDRFATARDFAVALQAAIRRAEDQTVVPPANPNKRVEPVLSRPLTTPGTVPGGVTTPSVGSSTSVTQELELVYWKDVKDATDPEELQEFLERFPAGIYSDLARRRLRKLGGGEQTVVGGGTQSGAGAFAGSVFPNSAFPNNETGELPGEASRPGSAPPGPDLRPSSWIGEEYTRTLVQSPGAGAAPAPVPAPPATASAAAVPAPAPTPAPASVVAAAPAAAALPAAAATAVAASPTRPDAAAKLSPAPPPARSAAAKAEEPRAPAGSGRKKAPLAVFAGLAALAVAAGIAAMVLGRGVEKPPVEAAQAAGSASVAAAEPVVVPAPAPAPTPVAAAPTDVPAGTQAARGQPVGVPPPPAPGALVAKSDKESKAAAKKERDKAAAKAGAVPPAAAPEASVRAAPLTPPRIEPEPPAPRQPATNVAANANYQSVDQCKDRMFLARQMCLTEQCDKAGARNHPLCVKHREEARIREESKVPR